MLLGAAAGSTAANNRLNLAVVGCGGQGTGDMRGLIGCGVNVVALCDPDAAQMAQARRAGGKATKTAKAYEDYRKLLDDSASFDAVLIATPDHWHAPLCKAFMKAGKHVYCEKPLTHSVAEARELRELARASNVVTQMGNQGSASPSLRRCTEIIRAGAGSGPRDLITGASTSGPARACARARTPFPPASIGTSGSGPLPCGRSTRPIIPGHGGTGSTSAMAAWPIFGAMPSTCHCGRWTSAIPSGSW